MTSPDPLFPPPRPRDPKSVGGYRIVGRLGAGGMGVVHAGRDPSGGLAAIKLVHGDLAADPDFRARFRREADLVRRVVSPCVPRFLASDTEAARPWLATEYVSGPTLSRHVREHGPLSGANLRAFAVGAAEALRAIHGAGIVHRDLKPGNVVLGVDGPKVLDFGIARAMAETAITRTGELFGTPGWVAPELLRGGGPSPAADVFAWGGLVAFAATGRNPFGGGSVETVAVRVLDGRPDLDGVPTDLMPLVVAAMGNEPIRRPGVEDTLSELLDVRHETRDPQDGPEVATTLVTRLLRDDWEAPPPPTVLTPPGGDTPPARTGRAFAPRRESRPGRRRAALITAGTTAVLLVSGLGWFLGSRFGEGDPGSTGTVGEADGTAEEAVVEAGGVEEGGVLAVELTGDGLFTVHADESGELEVVQGFDGVGPALPEGTERGEYAIATVRVQTVSTDFTSQVGVRVTGEVDYVADDGEFTLRSGDLTLLEVGEGLDPLPDDPTADGRTGHTAEPDEILATVDPGSPTAEFEVEFPDAPHSGLLAYLPAATAHGGDDTVRGVYACYMNWHPLPPVDMTDEEYVPCWEEPPSE